MCGDPPVGVAVPVSKAPLEYVLLMEQCAWVIVNVLSEHVGTDLLCWFCPYADAYAGSAPGMAWWPLGMPRSSSSENSESERRVRPSEGDRTGAREEDRYGSMWYEDAPKRF